MANGSRGDNPVGHYSTDAACAPPQCRGSLAKSSSPRDQLAFVTDCLRRRAHFGRACRTPKPPTTLAAHDVRQGKRVHHRRFPRPRSRRAPPLPPSMPPLPPSTPPPPAAAPEAAHDVAHLRRRLRRRCDRRQRCSADSTPAAPPPSWRACPLWPNRRRRCGRPKLGEPSIPTS